MAASRSTGTRRTTTKAAAGAKASAAAEEVAPVEHVEGQEPLVELAPGTVADEAPAAPAVSEEEVAAPVAPEPIPAAPGDEPPADHHDDDHDETPAAAEVPEDAEPPVSRAALLAQFVNPEAAPQLAEPEAPATVPATGKNITIPGEDLATAQCVWDLFIFHADGQKHQAYKGDYITRPASDLARGVKLGALVIVA